MNLLQKNVVEKPLFKGRKETEAENGVHIGETATHIRDIVKSLHKMLPAHAYHLAFVGGSDGFQAFIHLVAGQYLRADFSPQFRPGSLEGFYLGAQSIGIYVLVP